LLLVASALFAACGGGGGGGGGEAHPASAAGVNTATLTWDAVADPSLSGYRVYFGTAPGMYLQSLGQGLNVGNVTTYVVTGLGSGRYYFAATAYDIAGNESDFSSETFKDVP
jgi:hypothetical protein